MKKGISILVGLAVALSLLSGCGNKKVDVSVFANVVFTGTNGHASVSIETDPEIEKAIATAVYGKSVIGSDSADAIQKMMITEYFTNSVLYEITSKKTEDLKNGDVLTIKTSYSKEAADKLKISPTGTTFKYTVEGLKDAKEIDPFDGLVLTYEGVAPNAVVSIDKSKTAEYVKNNVSFTVTPSSGVANGDVIDVVAVYDPAKADQNGVFLTKTESQYTAKGVQVVPSDLSGLDMSAVDSQQESTINQYIATDIIGHTPASEWIIKASASEGDMGCYNYECTAATATVVKKTYLLAKDLLAGSQSTQNKYILFYETTVTMEKTHSSSSLFSVGGDVNIPVGTIVTTPVYTYAVYENFATDPEQTTIATQGQYRGVENYYTTLDEAYNDAVLSYQADMTYSDIPLS